MIGFHAQHDIKIPLKNILAETYIYLMKIVNVNKNGSQRQPRKGTCLGRIIIILADPSPAAGRYNRYYHRERFRVTVKRQASVFASVWTRVYRGWQGIAWKTPLQHALPTHAKKA